MKREEQIRKAALRQCLGSGATAERKRRKWIEGAMWSDAHPVDLWKDAQGDNLPAYDREVVVLIQDCPDDDEHLRVAFGHRPNPNGWLTKEGERLYAMTYDKGGWNGKNIRYWLDVKLPNEH